MPTPETETWLALKSRIDTLPIPADWEVYEPDVTVEPPHDEIGPLPYVLVSDVRNEHQRIGISGNGKVRGVLHIRSGTLMLALHYPVARPATYTQLVEMAGKIAAHFPADTRMKYGSTCLRVTQDADADQPYREGVDRVLIVRVRWANA